MTEPKDRASRYAVTIDPKSGLMHYKPKAAPRLLPQDMRQLPSSHVTGDIADGSKVHETDDPHTKGALQESIQAQEQGRKNPLTESETEPQGAHQEADPRKSRVTQEAVDWIRLRVLKSWASTQKRVLMAGGEVDWGVKYLWFPKDDINAYEMRAGNPPSNSERPRHLRYLQLEIDLQAKRLPRTIEDKLNEQARLDALRKSVVDPALGTRLPGLPHNDALELLR